MAELTIKPYSPDMRGLWDGFAAASKNATLLHRRGYMEYHAERFPDSSLVAFRAGKPYALLPATFDGRVFSSHAGLTYGGLVVGDKATVVEVGDIMEMIRLHVRRLGAKEFIYKPVPHIYHRLPAEEDLYALFRMEARIVARNVSAVVDTTQPLRMRNIRRSGARKAEAAGVEIIESDDLATFWEILTGNLVDRYGVTPVHTLDEILRLHTLFPGEIRLHVARKEDVMLGGTLIYATPRVAHVQYISASPEGKRLHALDLLFSRLLGDTYAATPLFDFGTSNEDSGRYLNESLIYQKEGFGGRAVVYDTYSIPL